MSHPWGCPHTMTAGDVSCSFACSWGSVTPGGGSGATGARTRMEPEGWNPQHPGFVPGLWLQCTEPSMVTPSSCLILFLLPSHRCYNCGGLDHHAKECKLPPQPKNHGARRGGTGEGRCQRGPGVPAQTFPHAQAGKSPLSIRMACSKQGKAEPNTLLPAKNPEHI
uniref:CCHC-type domain-containing protein n=1 Tax=Zosterops lateralis melanops TaxID=1220523 RepID=A0A8D2NSR1_ZOSLA